MKPTPVHQRKSHTDSSAHHAPPPGLAPAKIWSGIPLEERGELFVHESLSSLDLLEKSWKLLTSEHSSPFQTFAWNAAWYRSYATGGLLPLIFEWRRHDQTAALLPCYREGKTLRLAADRIGGHQDAIARSSRDVAALLMHVRRWLGREGRGYHFRFDQVANGGLLRALWSHPETLPPASRCRDQVRTWQYRVEWRDGGEGFLQGLSLENRAALEDAWESFEREQPGNELVVRRAGDIAVEELWQAAAFHVAHCGSAEESPFQDHRLIDHFARIAQEPETGFRLSLLQSASGEGLAVDFGFVREGNYYGYLRTEAVPGAARQLFLKQLQEGMEHEAWHSFQLPLDEPLLGTQAETVWSMRFLPDDIRGRLCWAGLEAGRHLRRVVGRLTAWRGGAR